MKAREGSITVYLCLMMVLMLSLLSAAFYSVKAEAGRARCAVAMDLALFSCLARYDRDLFEEFDVFFVDGGCETAAFRPDKIGSRFEEDFSAKFMKAKKNNIEKNAADRAGQDELPDGEPEDIGNTKIDFEISEDRITEGVYLSEDETNSLKELDDPEEYTDGVQDTSYDGYGEEYQQEEYQQEEYQQEEYQQDENESADDIRRDEEEMIQQ